LADLALGQSDELVDSRARVAQRSSGNRERKEPKDRKAIQPIVQNRPSNSENTRSRGNEQLLGDGIMLPVPRRPSVCQVS